MHGRWGAPGRPARPDRNGARVHVAPGPVKRRSAFFWHYQDVTDVTTFTRLCRARDLLRETDSDPLSIEAVARAAAVSPFHFIRQFRALFGETPHQYRIRARIERAKDLLASSDYSVTDVCMEVGFSSLGSFSDLFARRVGTAPSVYRRQCRSRIVVPGVTTAVHAGCLPLMAAAFAIFEKRAAVPSVRLGS
jgi:AraC-like DNA-binding protein